MSVSTWPRSASPPRRVPHSTSTNGAVGSTNSRRAAPTRHSKRSGSGSGTISRFRGNTDDYSDPENSFLDSVMTRRVGIPITLSVLMMEVGRRIGVDIDGVGMPGHFLVRPRVAEAEATWCDPFHGFALLGARRVQAPLRPRLRRPHCVRSGVSRADRAALDRCAHAREPRTRPACAGPRATGPRLRPPSHPARSWAGRAVALGSVCRAAWN